MVIFDYFVWKTVDFYVNYFNFSCFLVIYIGFFLFAYNKGLLKFGYNRKIVSVQHSSNSFLEDNL